MEALDTHSRLSLASVLLQGALDDLPITTSCQRTSEAFESLFARVIKVACGGPKASGLSCRLDAIVSIVQRMEDRIEQARVSKLFDKYLCNAKDRTSFTTLPMVHMFSKCMILSIATFRASVMLLQAAREGHLLALVLAHKQVSRQDMYSRISVFLHDISPHDELVEVSPLVENLPVVMEMDHGGEVGAQRDAGLLAVQADFDWADHVECMIHAGADTDGDNGHTNLNQDDIHEEPVWLYPYMRMPKEFMAALLNGPELENIRRIMDVSRCSYILEETGAKIFVRPEQYETVLEALVRSDTKLRSSHIIVADSLLTYLEECVSKLPSKTNVRVKKDGISLILRCQANSTGSSSAADLPGFSPEQEMEVTSLSEMAPTTDATTQDVKDWDEILCVKRTFICLCKTNSNSDSVTQSTSEAHGGMNPRRLV